MCGICGIFVPGGRSPEDADAVGAMMNALNHRGPDGDGILAENEVVLGHRRLAIIDLEGGYQPLLNETSDIAVVFNGEIYNYRELREALRSAGHSFRSSSDTEVLVHGYEEWGDDFVARLRGMFAFALWDGRERRLVLGRDRLGIKPLYYHRSARGRFAFASEIKGLFSDPAIPRALNHERLAEYLAFRSVSGEETLFAGIRELAPGSLMILEQGVQRIRRYWSADVDPQEQVDQGVLVERGRALLTDAVAARLVSDVELGTITSGGLDSSLVSAVAGRLIDAPLDTFCVGFADPRFDERPFARDVSNHIRSRHHEIVVSADDIDRELDRLTWAHDEPLTHPNSIPMHLVFRQAKEHAGVTVLLSGEGADEVFGGYGWYRVGRRRDSLRRIPGLRLAASLIPLRKMATLRKVLHPDYPFTANAVSGRASIDSLVPSMGEYIGARRALWPSRGEMAEGMFVYDQRTYLAPLLQRQDRMSMAAGVEARVPFLDHALVEWANAQSADAKLPDGELKGLLKQIAEQWLPRNIIRRRKVGFAMPLGDWLRPGAALGHRVDRLRDSGSPLQEIVRGAAMDRLIDEHNHKTADHGDLLWTLIALDSWARVFLQESVRHATLPGAFTGRSGPTPSAGMTA